MGTETHLEDVNFSRNELSKPFTDDFLEVEEPYRQMISDDLLWNLNLYINIILCGIMAFFGTFNNAVNMTIFYQLGLKDSMNVFLFSLAVTDFLVSLVILSSRSFPIWQLFFKDQEREPMTILYASLIWPADSLFLCSGWITTLLSLERCVCVILPFKVKRIFTKNRAIAAIVALHVITGATCIPMYLTHWLQWVNVRIPLFNTSIPGRRLVIKFSDNRELVEYYVELFNVSIIPVPSQITVLASVFSMVYGLVKSSKLRQSMAGNIEEKDHKLEYKTKRLVMVVLLLAMIFIVCSVPRTCATYISLIHPEINAMRKERNMSIFLWQFARLFSTLNASVNIFVYLKINTSYRAKFRDLLSCFKK